MKAPVYGRELLKSFARWLCRAVPGTTCPTLDTPPLALDETHDASPCRLLRPCHEVGSVTKLRHWASSFTKFRYWTIFFVTELPMTPPASLAPARTHELWHLAPTSYSSSRPQAPRTFIPKLCLVPIRRTTTNSRLVGT